MSKRPKPLKPILNRDEIFSQAVTDSMLQDEYEEDSFVTDVIEYESSTADELDFVPEFSDKAKRGEFAHLEIMSFVEQRAEQTTHLPPYEVK